MIAALQALPAQAEAVAAHIASMADAGLKPATGGAVIV
jgi:hypothetical protein